MPVHEPYTQRQSITCHRYAARPTNTCLSHEPYQPSHAHACNTTHTRHVPVHEPAADAVEAADVAVVHEEVAAAAVGVMLMLM